MSNKNAIERYLVIDYYLHNSMLTLEELVGKVNEYLCRNGLQSVSARTVRGDLYNMMSIFNKTILKSRSSDNKVHYRYVFFSKPIFTNNE